MIALLLLLATQFNYGSCVVVVTRPATGGNQWIWKSFVPGGAPPVTGIAYFHSQAVEAAVAACP